MVDDFKKDIPDPPVRPSAEESLRRSSQPRRLTREAIREEPIAREPVRVPAGERLQRRRRRTENPFDLSPDIVAEAAARGMSLEWKRESVFGKPDTSHQVQLRDNHWAPVPASRYPWLMSESEQNGPIRRDGQILMERPSYLTEEARQEDYQEARMAVKIKEQQMARTPEGTLTRDDPRIKPKIKKEYEPLIVPKE